ncbi:MAG TPA: ABC transporter ATP-binding protein [Caldimonas sp.]
MTGAATAAPLLEVRGLAAQYGPTRVLHGIDFAVAEGGITAVLGANGAGKTTLLRAVCNMIRTSGEVRLAGDRIDGLQTETIVRRGVAHVPDGRGTFMNLSVEENLRLGAHTRKDRHEVGADCERMYAHFPRLKERRRQQAGTLSGGEQQMVAVGRALMLRPALLLLDEPSHGLAPKVVEEMHEAFKTIHSRGTSILLVEQNVELALEVATRGYVLEAGVVTLAGTAAELHANPAVVTAYLGL